MIDEKVSQACPKCGTMLTILSRPIIDEAADPQMFARFMDDELNPKACSRCGLTLKLDTPCIVLREHWLGVVLANPQPIPIDLACEVVFTFLLETPSLGRRPDRPVLVTGNVGQLRRVIRNEVGSRFCLIRFDDLGRINRSQEIVALNVVADAYLEHDLPEQAYWVYESAFATFPDVYFDRRFFDALELTALAAGERIAKGLKEPRTAPDDLEQKKAMLEPHRPEVPDWLEDIYLCFYEDDREFCDFLPFPWSVRVELLQIDDQGRVPLERSELHFTSVCVQAVQPQEPSLLDRGILRILIMLRLSEARRMLPEEPMDFGWVRELTPAFLQLEWERMSPTEQNQLHEIYAQLTEGRDVIHDFALDSSGDDDR